MTPSDILTVAFIHTSCKKFEIYRQMEFYRNEREMMSTI